MKKTVLTAGCLATVLASGAPARASELWEPHLRGINEGLASAVLPPKGFYFLDYNYFWSVAATNDVGQRTGIKLHTYVNVPALIWAPGIKIFGADYAFSIAQPFDNLSAWNVPSGNGEHWGAFNTQIGVGTLAWTLPHGLHIATGLTIAADDATSTAANPPKGGGLGSGNSFWDIQPRLALTWFENGWNISADIYYDHSLEDHKLHYQNADEISVDYTVTKTIGKWTLGLGAGQQNQLGEDTIKGVRQGGTMAKNFSIGPILGINFKYFGIMAIFNKEIVTNNDVGGDSLNIRFFIPL